jgi:hypothetical protein
MFCPISADIHYPFAVLEINGRILYYNRFEEFVNPRTKLKIDMVLDALDKIKLRESLAYMMLLIWLI